jgi:hypothetical protein
MTLLLWSIAISRVILTLDVERVISRRGEQVVPLRHKLRNSPTGKTAGRMISSLAGESLPRDGQMSELGPN